MVIFSFSFFFSLLVFYYYLFNHRLRACSMKFYSPIQHYNSMHQNLGRFSKELNCSNSIQDCCLQLSRVGLSQMSVWSVCVTRVGRRGEAFTSSAASFNNPLVKAKGFFLFLITSNYYGQLRAEKIILNKSSLPPTLHFIQFIFSSWRMIKIIFLIIIFSFLQEYYWVLTLLHVSWQEPWQVHPSPWCLPSSLLWFV